MSYSPNQEDVKFLLDIFKDGKDILDSLTPAKLELLHAAIGIAGEGGEILDAFKKHVIYNLPLDEKNVREELGDLLYYVFQMFVRLNINLEDVIESNIAKLRRRYPNGYSDDSARARLDKQND